MKNIVLIIAYLSFLVACKQSPQGDRDQLDNAIQIDIDKKDDLSFYDIFSKMEIFPLETVEAALIKRVGEFAIHDGKYYILDKDLNCIFTFDLEGEFLGQINKQGSGPGEYTELYDFGFNRFSGNLELLSPMSGIHVYDSLATVYKHHINLPSSVRAAHYFVNYSSDQYVFFSDPKKGTKMVFYNPKQDKIVHETYDVPDYLLTNTLYGHSHNPFYLYNDTLHFVQGCNGDVFVLENGKLRLKYRWDFGEYNFNLSDLPPNKDLRYYMEYHRTTGINFASIFIKYGENSQYYITQFYLRSKIYHLFYNKKTKSPFLFNSFKEVGFSCPRITNESAAYSYITPDLLDKFVNPDLLDAENRKRYESIAHDSNPVIIKYTFKKK